MKHYGSQALPGAVGRIAHGLIGNLFTAPLSAALWFVLVAALLVLVPESWCQDNATITGTVIDASGALVPNAEVSITNPATGQKRGTVSNSAGAYRFANVGVGNYTLNVSAHGFQKYSKTDIVVNVAQSLEENISLAVGSQEQTISVAADALQVQTDTSEVSTLISGQQVSELSTNGRNITSLAALGMGVSNNLPQYGGIDALTSSNAISFNGARQTHNIYMIDNAEQNDRGCGGCFMNLPSQDAIAEFQTLDSNYTPDYGVGSGGTILMVLKGGTKSFHGELYEFNRNTDYNANDYFNKTGATAKPRPTFQLNEPGGNIGGPIWIPHVYDDARSRTFFFVNEEWRKLIQGSAPSPINTILASNFPTAGQSLTYTPWNGNPPVVPTTSDPAKLALYTADGLTPGAAFPNNVIPANLIDQNAVLELNAGTFPKPNDGPTQYIASINQPENIREDVVRIDHSFNSKYQLMGHYLHDAMTKSFFPPLWGPGGDYPTVGTAMTNPSYTAAIRLTQTYSSNLLNETAFLYSGNKITLTPVAGAGNSFTLPSGWSATSYFPVANNAGKDMPEIDLQGSPLNQTWTESYYPWKNGYEGFDYRDDVSWTKGRHQFKFGFAWLHDYKNQQLQANTQGTAAFNSSNFSGDSYVNFLLGMTSSFTQLEFLAGKHWVNNNYGFYGNDNWHVTPRLTLNLGLRFDGLPHAFERYNKFANFVPADYDASQPYPLNPADGTILPATLSTFSQTGSEQFYLNGIREANVAGFPRGNVQNSYKTWQPRIGFAYSLTGNGRTVLRGGFGMFFERVQGNDVYNAALNPPFAYQPSATNVYFSDPNTSALTGATTQQHFPSNLTTLKYNYPPPGTADFSFGLQREVAKSVVAVIQYVGSTGWDQNNDRQINALPLADLTHRQLVATGKTNTNLWRNYPGFANINQEENETNFSYHSLQAGIRAENRHGLTTQLSYTWSHNISEVVNDLGGLSNPYNAKYDRASDTGFDRRHIFNASYVYAVPFFQKSSNLAARTILGNWEISGITAVEAGLPQFITYTGSNVTGLGDGTNRPNKVASVSYPKKVSAWYTKASFGDPVAPWAGGPNQGFGNAGRDAVVGPGLFNWNLSVFKTIPLREHDLPKFELRFESFNTFNHTEFQNLDNNSHDGNFGAVTGDYGPRLLELGGKFVF
jgi:Carboxypeptidase regulatory-like domain